MSTPIVLSYGMGVESTAILLRWLLEPSSRDFDLADLLVITAMTGDEFIETARDVATHVLPLLNDHGVRYVQIARNGPTQAEGITVLSDSRTTYQVHYAGVWKLSDELMGAGTVPQFAAGRRTCSVKFKGWPLDTWLDDEMGTRSFRHAMGFNADEGFRVDRDRSYSTEDRPSEYPLMEWGWDRATCVSYIARHTGVARWPKSCCTFCPFARDNHLDRYRADPVAGADALLLEHRSLMLNPAMSLFSNKILRELVERDGNEKSLALYRRRLAEGDAALYRVRRVYRAHKSGPMKKGQAWRQVHRLATGDLDDMNSRLHALGIVSREAGIDRVYRRRPGRVYPATEEMYVVGPATIADKGRKTFDALWDATLAAGPSALFETGV